MRVSRRIPLFGSVKPTASKSEKRPFASPSPRKSPTIEASTPITSASSTTESRHLPARRAERAQRRELARPLRDRDRERVDDHESADEQRDQAEREQEVAQERDELVRLLRVLARLGVAGAHLGVRRQDLADLRDQRGWRDPRLRGDADLVELALLAEEPLGGREVEACERGSADRAHRPELHDPGDPHLPDGALCLHADRRCRPSGPPCRPSTCRRRPRSTRATRRARGSGC